jgi:hypothetical protein
VAKFQPKPLLRWRERGRERGCCEREQNDSPGFRFSLNETGAEDEHSLLGADSSRGAKRRDRSAAVGMQLSAQRITAGRVVVTQRSEFKAMAKSRRTEMNMYMRQNVNRNLPRNVRLPPRNTRRGCIPCAPSAANPPPPPAVDGGPPKHHPASC